MLPKITQKGSLPVAVSAIAFPRQNMGKGKNKGPLSSILLVSELPVLWSLLTSVGDKMARLKHMLYPQFDNQGRQRYCLSFTVTCGYPVLFSGFSQYHHNHQKFSNNIEHQKGKKKGVSSPLKTWLLMQICSTPPSHL